MGVPAFSFGFGVQGIDKWRLSRRRRRRKNASPKLSFLSANSVFGLVDENSRQHPKNFAEKMFLLLENIFRKLIFRDQSNFVF